VSDRPATGKIHIDVRVDSVISPTGFELALSANSGP
jgi:hypothetical protein